MHSITAFFLLKLMKYKHILIDLDRTLWDFESNSGQTMRELFAQFDLQRLCHADFQTFFDAYHTINSQLWQAYNNGTLSKEVLYVSRFSLTLEHFGVDNAFALGKQLGDYYVFESPKKTSLIPGAIELLEYLKSKKYNLSIVSNGFKEVQREKMRTSGIDGYFGHVFLSEDIGYQKPDRRFFAWVLENLCAVPDQCVIIGDDLKVDIAGARNAGIDQIFCNFTDAKPDFQPTRTVRHLTDILSLL